MQCYVLFLYQRALPHSWFRETMNFSVSHVSIFSWMKKFACLLQGNTRSMAFSNIWYADEKFIKVKCIGGFAYILVVMDNQNSIVAVHVYSKRDVAGAQTVLAIVKDRAEKPPIS